MVLYGLDFTEADIDADAGLQAGAGFGAISTQLGGPLQGSTNLCFQLVQFLFAVWNRLSYH